MTIKETVNKNRIYIFLSVLYILILSLCELYLGRTDHFLRIHYFRFSFADLTAPYITWLGDGWMVGTLLLLFSFTSRKQQVTLLIGWLLSIIMVQSMKHLIFYDMLRPAGFFGIEKLIVLPGVHMHTHHSFPSGHTASAFMLWGILSHFNEKKSGKIACFILAALAGWSRVYLGQHFPSDVIIGAFIGLISMLIALKIADKTPEYPTLFEKIKTLKG